MNWQPKAMTATTLVGAASLMAMFLAFLLIVDFYRVAPGPAGVMHRHWPAAFVLIGLVCLPVIAYVVSRRPWAAAGRWCFACLAIPLMLLGFRLREPLLWPCLASLLPFVAFLGGSLGDLHRHARYRRQLHLEDRSAVFRKAGSAMDE